MSSLLLDHARQECLQRPEMRQGVDRKSPEDSMNGEVVISIQTSDSLLNVLRAQLKQRLPLHNARVIDEHRRVAELCPR